MMESIAILSTSVYLIVAASMAIRMANKIESYNRATFGEAYPDLPKPEDMGVASSYARSARNVNIMVLLTAVVGMAWSAYKLAPKSAKSQIKEYVGAA